MVKVLALRYLRTAVERAPSGHGSADAESCFAMAGGRGRAPVDAPYASHSGVVLYAAYMPRRYTSEDSGPGPDAPPGVEPAPIKRSEE